VSQSISPLSIASKTRYSVIILVMLAGGNALSASFSYNTFPVSASTIMADFAFVSNDFASDACGYKAIANIIAKNKVYQTSFLKFFNNFPTSNKFLSFLTHERV